MLFIASCNRDSITLDVGEEMVNSSTRMVVVDTFSIKMSTAKLDSFATSGEEILLTGTCNDDKTGNIAAKSYFEVGLPDYSISEGEYYDSISLILRYNGYSYGDTMFTQHLSVYRIFDDFEFASDQDYFYNTSSLRYYSTPVGEIDFRPRPASGKELSIGLDDNLGRALFGYLEEYEDDEEAETEFTDILKGFVLESTGGNAVIGYDALDTTLYLRMYTHTVELEEELNEIDFPFTNSDLQFNQISCDWSNNPVFEDLAQKNEVPASETGNMTLVQAGLGLFTNVQFNTLPAILEFDKHIVVQALLYFEPLNKDSRSLPSPENLLIYKTGRKNRLEDQLTDANGYDIVPSLNIDEFYDETTNYIFDITDYVNDELADYYLDPETALSISFGTPALSGSVDQLLLGGFDNARKKPRLELLFLFYDQ